MGGTTSNSPSGSVYFDIYKYAASTLTYSNYCTTVTTAIITLNSACTDGTLVYGTYSNSSAFVVSEDIVVSEINVIGGKLNIESYKTGDVVPANTGVMVSALTGGNYTVTLSSEKGTSILGNNNMLRATGDGITAQTMAINDANCLYYRLTMHNSTEIGYWWGAENGAAFAITAGKAYLAVPTSQARQGFTFGRSTGIESVVSETRTDGKTVFDLQGRRVEQPAKGLYIVNGKKVIINK